MKDDLPPRPARVPAKARQLAVVPDLWVAQWLASDQLTPSERRRLEALKAGRRATQPDVPVGLLVGAEGVTPRQQATVLEMLQGLAPTEIHHPGVASRLHSACKALGVPVHDHRDTRRAESGMEEIIRASMYLVAAPREMTEVGPDSIVWRMIRRAKHRRKAVRVVLPNGRLLT